MPSRAEGAQARLYGLGLDAVGTRQRGGGQSVRQDRGRRVVAERLGQIGDVGKRDGLAVAVLNERAIDQQTLDDAQLGHGRRTEGHADSPRTLNDVRVLNHGLDAPIRGGVHASAHRVLVDARLVRRVGLDAAMPVQVIGVHVQADGGQRAHRQRRV